MRWHDSCEETSRCEHATRHVHDHSAVTIWFVGAFRANPPHNQMTTWGLLLVRQAKKEQPACVGAQRKRTISNFSIPKKKAHHCDCLPRTTMRRRSQSCNARSCPSKGRPTSNNATGLSPALCNTF